MNLEDIRQTLTTHLNDWDKTNTTTTIYDNRTANDIDATKPFVKLNINYGTARTASIPRSRRRTGTITLQCFAPINSGTKNLTLITDELVSHFEYFRTTDRKLWTTASEVFNVPNDNFYQTNIRLTFWASDI